MTLPPSMVNTGFKSLAGANPDTMHIKRNNDNFFI
jgi:hypothetical protein